MPPRQSPSAVNPVQQAPIVPARFDVSALPPDRQLLAWRDRVGPAIDVVLSRAQVELPFRACFDRYRVGDFIFDDCYSDQVVLDRSIARISRDSARSMVFYLFLYGRSSGSVSYAARRNSASLDIGILAVDLDRPIRMLRQACRHIIFFVPAHRLQHVFADPGVLHGRVLAPQRPAVQLIVGRVTALLGAIRRMSANEAERCLDDLLALILAAYGEDAGLAGSRSALARAAMFDSVRRFVHANLGDSALTPEYVIEALGLSRPTIYRLFQHEGGLGSYIQDLRLRTAADDLVRFPSIQIQDVAYSLGFGSASAFTRAFRRAFDIAPQEIRLSRNAPAKALSPVV